jgi:hypothetical protein
VVPSSEAEGARVLLEHAGYHGLRFLVVFATNGQAVAWEVADHRYLPNPFESEPADDPSWGALQPVTAGTLRNAPYGVLERAARAKLEETSNDISSGLSPDRGRMTKLRRLAAGGRRPGPKGGGFAFDDLHFARVARDYVAALKYAKPVQVVAGQWNYAPRTVQNWLMEARRRGLLTRPRAGRAEGALTPKAKKLLQERGK